VLGPCPGTTQNQRPQKSPASAQGFFLRRLAISR
jgi:hypothetical protein